MNGYLLLYAQSFAAALCLLEARWKVRDHLARRGARRDAAPVWADALPLVLVLSFFVIARGRFDTVARGLTLSSILLIFASALVGWAGRSRLWMLPAEVAAATVLVAHGVVIPFFSNPAGGYYYLYGASAPLTVLWLVMLVNALKIGNLLPGLFSGVVALMAYLFLGSLFYQGPKTPEATLLALVVSGLATAMWIHGNYRESLSRAPEGEGGITARPLGAGAVAAWGLILGCISVVGTSKTVALVSVATPLMLAAAPVAFFTYVIVQSYFRPKVLPRRSSRVVTVFRLTRERLVSVVLLFCLLGNLLVLGYLYTSSAYWLLGSALVALLLMGRLSALLFLKKRRKAELPGTKNVSVLGIPFPATSFKEVMARIEGFVEDGGRHYVVTPDSLSLLRTTLDRRYRAALLNADLCVPDGAGVVWAADFLHERPLLEQTPGCELAEALCARAAERGWRVFLLGTRSETLDAAVAALEERHPGLRIVGSHDGFFTLDEEPALADAIAATRPDVVFVALGVPKQEGWILRNLGRVKAGLMMGVGGTIDVWGGAVRRAPERYQSWGLEWAYRLVREPLRVKRMAFLPLFVFEVMREKLRLTRPEARSEA